MPNPTSADSPPMELYARRSANADAGSGGMLARVSSLRNWLGLLLVAACFLWYQSFIAKSISTWTTPLPILVGAYFIIEERRANTKALKLLTLHDYYEAGIARLKRDWSQLDEGSDFADPDHFYATDLDLFGRGSLFQLLCSARTKAGRETLANWMKEAASPEEVTARRAAVQELRPRQDLRESLAIAGPYRASDVRPGTFKTWANEPISPYPFWAPILAPLLVLGWIVPPILYWVGLMDEQTLWAILVTVLLARSAFAVATFRRVRDIEESSASPSVELPVVCELLAMVRKETFSSAKLIAIQACVREGEPHLRRLRTLIGLLKERDNPYFSPVAYFLLWGTHFTIAIDRWRRREGARMLHWLSALAEFEALMSVATYSYEHPADPFAEILESGPALDAEELGHPLLEESACVRNDVSLGGSVLFLMVSGSNMSGKSTYVRAIGLNAVLAWMGAPVRAKSLRLSRLAVGAAIRLQDSLADGRSHFFAEMQRLRRMIDLAGERPMLYLADEIMSGTNSKDRRIATEWVVRALVLRNAIGVITTHDLALTEIASNGLPGQNVHFEDTGEGGEIHFDYKLRPGVLVHSNALNIAHMLGIDAAATGQPEKDKA